MIFSSFLTLEYQTSEQLIYRYTRLQSSLFTGIPDFSLFTGIQDFSLFTGTPDFRAAFFTGIPDFRAAFLQVYQTSAHIQVYQTSE